MIRSAPGAHIVERPRGRAERLLRAPTATEASADGRRVIRGARVLGRDPVNDVAAHDRRRRATGTRAPPADVAEGGRPPGVGVVDHGARQRPAPATPSDARVVRGCTQTFRSTVASEIVPRACHEPPARGPRTKRTATAAQTAADPMAAQAQDGGRDGACAAGARSKASITDCTWARTSSSGPIGALTSAMSFASGNASSWLQHWCARVRVRLEPCSLASTESAPSS